MHDTACRVIARLKKERDDARGLMSLVERQIPMTASAAATVNDRMLSNGRRAAEDDDLGSAGKKLRPGISVDTLAELAECNSSLSQQRKRRQDIIAIGGLNTNAVIFDRTSGQILSTLSEHSRKVNSVKFITRDELFVTGSADKTVHIWQRNEEGNYNCLHILKDHTKEMQAVTVHATNNYFVIASMDNTWCFYDLASGQCLTQVEFGDASSESEGYTSAAFHPDGLILGTGTSDLVVKVWDVKSQSNVAKFDGHVGPVPAMSFSENGYFLATAAKDGVKLWDLRKLRNFRTLSPYDQDTPTYTAKFILRIFMEYGYLCIWANPCLTDESRV